MEAASLVGRNDKTIETTGRLLDETDKAVTRALLEAEKSMLTPQWARSHPWNL